MLLSIRPWEKAFAPGEVSKKKSLSLREGQVYICAGSRTTAGGGAGSLRVTHPLNLGTQCMSNTEF